MFLIIFAQSIRQCSSICEFCTHLPPVHLRTDRESASKTAINFFFDSVSLSLSENVNQNDEYFVLRQTNQTSCPLYVWLFSRQFIRPEYLYVERLSFDCGERKCCGFCEEKRRNKGGKNTFVEKFHIILVSNQTRIKFIRLFRVRSAASSQFLEWIFLVCHLENNLRGPARWTGTNGLCAKCSYVEMLWTWRVLAINCLAIVAVPFQCRMNLKSWKYDPFWSCWISLLCATFLLEIVVNLKKWDKR